MCLSVTDCSGGDGSIPSASNCAEYFTCGGGQVVANNTCTLPGSAFDQSSGGCGPADEVPCANIGRKEKKVYIDTYKLN